MRIRHSLLHLGSFFMATLMVGCSSSPLGNGITISKQLIVPIVDEEGAPACTIDFELQFADNNSVVGKAINSELVKTLFNYEELAPEVAVDSFVSNYVNNYKRELLSFYEADSARAISSWYHFNNTMRSTITDNNNGVINVVIEVSLYEGGANSNDYTIYHNYHIESGKEITLNDVFTPDYEAKLLSILESKLLEKFEVSSLDLLKQDMVLFNASLPLPANFLIKKGGIDFLYNRYEIAPRSTGAILLEVSNEELVELLVK